MESFPESVHLACHASWQNLEKPLNSGIHLHDGVLELSAITKKNLPNADFAFLSACQTSTGGRESSRRLRRKCRSDDAGPSLMSMHHWLLNVSRISWLVMIQMMEERGWRVFLRLEPSISMRLREEVGDGHLILSSHGCLIFMW